MTEQKRLAGLLLMTNHPQKGLVAVLQRRGVYNFETGTAESFPGLCQVTAIGGANGDGYEEIRFPIATILRETREELGREILSASPHLEVLLSSINDTTVYERNDDRIRKVILAVAVPYEHISLIRLHPSSGGLVFVGKDDPIYILPENNNGRGCPDLNIVMMFPDEREAVRRAFELLS